jgi:hypothetical protein
VFLSLLSTSAVGLREAEMMAMRKRTRTRMMMKRRKM